MHAIVTLTTDFGAGSPYVAQMKGVILSINPDARIIDITHAVPPQNVMAGAFALAEAAPWFPAGSIHVAVVDPGVGTDRKILLARINDRTYIAPDNGLLTAVAEDAAAEIVELNNPHYWQSEVSSTFHGRDIMAPVAAHVSRGISLDRVGSPLASIATLDWPQAAVLADRVEGQVISIDSFGNLITNIRRSDIRGWPAEEVVVSCGGRSTPGICNTYGERQAGSLVALIGSSGYLELAIVSGNAQRTLDVKCGTPVTLLTHPIADSG